MLRDRNTWRYALDPRDPDHLEFEDDCKDEGEQDEDERLIDIYLADLAEFKRVSLNT